MFEPAAKLLQDRLRARGVGVLRAHQADQLALPGRTGRTADRTLDEGGALRAHSGGERDLGARLDRTHLDEEFSPNIGSEQSGAAAIDGVDGGGIGENGDDSLVPACKLSGSRGNGGTGSSNRLYFLGGAVPDRERVPDFDKAKRDRRAHFADPSDPDSHRTCLLMLASTLPSWGVAGDDTLRLNAAEAAV